MLLKRESFVPVCIIFVFVCTSKGSLGDTKFFSFSKSLQLSYFTRYRETANGTRKSIVCTFTVLYFYLIRDTAFFCYSVLLLKTQPFYKTKDDQFSLSLSLSLSLSMRAYASLLARFHAIPDTRDL